MFIIKLFFYNYAGQIDWRKNRQFHRRFERHNVQLLHWRNSKTQVKILWAQFFENQFRKILLQNLLIKKQWKCYLGKMIQKSQRVGVNCSKFDCSTIICSTLLTANQLLDTKFINCSNPVNPGSESSSWQKKWQMVDTV